MNDETFAQARDAVSPVNAEVAASALAYHAQLTKPAGSLGELESVGVQLCAIAGQCPPPIPSSAVVAVFAADHGVMMEAVSPWPVEVTAQMVMNFCNGGAAINVIGRHTGADVVVIDVGVSSDLESHKQLIEAKVRKGTRNLAYEPAMTVEEAQSALNVGAKVAQGLVRAGANCLITGDMGIGNTTASAALIAAFTNRYASDVTGRGTGIDDAMLGHKVRVVEQAVSRTKSNDPIEILRSLGGLEHVALTGYIIAGAAARVPVIVDGVIALASLLAAVKLAPDCLGYCIAGHRSTEPGATTVLDVLELSPLVDIGLRLGEGTGACLALPMVQMSAKIMREMATFESAAVTARGE